jgi:outer membrane receptor for ferrienterochelin and colicins
MRGASSLSLTHSPSEPPRLRRPLCLAALALAGCSLFGRVARADDSSDLNALLTESIVSTPSKSSETASTAPATSSVITASDLRRWGIHSLDEAVNYLALGMVTTNPLQALEIGARGVLLTADFGAHVLVLVDGHAINEPWNGTAYVDRGLGIPLELIDHIEVVLGPGSVIYGSQAMLGVIQVVTKRARDAAGYRLILEGGLGLPTRHSGGLIAPSFGSGYVDRLGTSYRIAAGLGRELSLLGQPAELTLHLEYYRQDGPSFEFGPQVYGVDSVTGQPKDFGPRGTPGVWGGVTYDSYYVEVPAAYARLVWGDFTLSARGSIYTRATPYIDSKVNPVGDFDDPKGNESDRFANFSLEYSRTVSQLLDFSVRGYTDLYRYHWLNRSSAAEDCFNGSPAGCTQELTAGGTKLGGESELEFSWLPELRLSTLLGAGLKGRLIDSDLNVRDRGTGELSPAANDYSRTDLAAALYAEQHMSPLRWLDVNVGLRWDYDQRAKGSALSPRSAVGVTPWDQGRLKLIYSQAFRAPSAYEIEYANPTYQIKPEGLSAETVRSVEGSLEQRFGAQRFLLGAFRSWWRDMVALTALNAAELSAAVAGEQLDSSVTEAYHYRNLAKIQNYGINASFEGSLLGERLSYGLNLTDAISRVDQGDGSPHELTVGPSLFGNARVAYDFSEPWPTLGLALQYLGRRPADRAFDGGFAQRPYADPHVELRLTASGEAPFWSGLGYRLIGDYAFAKTAPYVIGPNQYAADDTTPYELAPVRRMQLFLELEYHYDP